ncbi:MAG: hypothetical protein GXC70_05880 [Sphingomonadaceae bacterium]|nr:hypothetical protein [Sphingomonadaceae bacterium]
MIKRAFALLPTLGLLAIAAPAEARNRTSDMLRTQFSGFSSADLQRYSRWLTGEDEAVFPGIYRSLGGFHASDGRRYQLLVSSRIFNQTGVPICVRAKERAAPGALSGMLAVDNSYKNLLIQPGSSESITTYSSTRMASGSFSVGTQTALLVWSPDMSAGTGRVCSSRAPWFLTDWDKASLDQTDHMIEPALKARLEGKDPNSIPRKSATSRAAQDLKAELGRRGVVIDPAGWSSVLSDDQAFRFGPLELTTAGAIRPGWIYGVAWIHNSGNQPICVAGDGGITITGLTAREGSAAPSTGFYLAPGRGRAMQTVAGTFARQMPVSSVKPAVLAYDPQAGRTGDGACQSVLPAAALRQVLDRRGFAAVGKDWRPVQR